MRVYHGTAARFPMKQLTGGPDTSALLGTPKPGLWLTTEPRLAATYASWSADCTESNYLRVIALEMNEDCPRWHNPQRKEDFVVRWPEREYENGNLKVLRGYHLKRFKLPGPPAMWELRVKWDLAEHNIIVQHADTMEALPSGFSVYLPGG